MQTQPRKEHEWLQQLVGDWTSEAEMKMAPGQPPLVFKGTESVRSIGGLWTHAEGQSEVPGGGTSTSLMTLGYDTNRQRFVGTFVSAMSDFLWVYDGGELDATGKVLTLSAEGPDMSPDAKGRMAKYRDVIEIVSKDHRLLRGTVLGSDGRWTEFMTAHYRRK